MYCPHCGQSLDDSARFCRFCGGPVRSAPTHPQSPRPQPARPQPDRPRSGSKGKTPKPPHDRDARLRRTLKIVLAVLIVVVVAGGAFTALLYTGVLDLAALPRIIAGDTVSVVRVSFDAPDDKSRAVITGYDADGNAIWDYETAEHGEGRVSELGLQDDRYYLVEDGAVLALDAQTGERAWKNDDFGGRGTDYAFGDDAIYLCSENGPDFYAVDYDGDTLSRIDHLADSDTHAAKIELEDGRIVITLRDEDGQWHIFYVDLEDFEPTEGPEIDEPQPETETEENGDAPEAAARRLVTVNTCFEDKLSETITYTYDNCGRIAEKVTDYRRYAYEYDEDGRLLSKKQPDSDYNGEEAIEREYNSDGQLVQENCYRIGDMWYETIYTYGTDGRIATEDTYNDFGGGGCVYSYSEDEDGYRTETRTGTYGGDYSGVYVYDPQGRVVQGWDEYWCMPVEYVYEQTEGEWLVYTASMQLYEGEWSTVAYIRLNDAIGESIEEVWLCSSDTSDRDRFDFIYDDEGYLIAVECGDQRAELIYEDAEAAANTTGQTGADEEDLYAQVLALFRQYAQSGWESYWDDYEQLAERCDWFEPSYVYSQYSFTNELGYCFSDINGDGVPELLIGLDDPYFEDTIMDMFTIADGEIEHLCSSGERFGYNLCEDGSIAYWASSSAWDYVQQHLYLPEGGARLTLLEVVYSTLDEASDGTAWYHAVGGAYNERTCEYAYEDLTPITESAAQAIAAEWPAQIALELTSLAD